MNKGYLFISNSSKPDMSVPSPTVIDIDSFSHAAVDAADKLGYKIYMGYNVDQPENLKCRQYDITYFHSNIYRSIFAFRDNYKAYKILCNFLKEHSEIEVIHCNTPIGGVIGRIVGHKFKKKVIYTAHGFHFYRGAPLFNRTILKWIEKWLAHYTDIIITINQEDFEAAQRFKLKRGGKVHLVNGVGIDTSKREPVKSKEDIYKSIGIEDNRYICISLGNLDKNKNFDTLIKSFERYRDSDIMLLICGRGAEQHNLERLIKKLNLGNNVKLLGFRKDVKDLLSISRVFFLASKREGLPRSTMEAMVAGLPCIVSDIRGNRDLIDDGEGGFLVSPNDIIGFANSLDMLIQNPKRAMEMGKYNQNRVIQFGIAGVERQLYSIYSTVIYN